MHLPWRQRPKIQLPEQSNLRLQMQNLPKKSLLRPVHRLPHVRGNHRRYQRAWYLGARDDRSRWCSRSRSRLERTTGDRNIGLVNQTRRRKAKRGTESWETETRNWGSLAVEIHGGWKSTSVLSRPTQAGAWGQGTGSPWIVTENGINKIKAGKDSLEGRFGRVGGVCNRT